MNAEPQRGVDALVKLWEAAQTRDGIAAVNKALARLSASKDFDSAFRRFTAANWAKNLSNQPDAVQLHRRRSSGQSGAVWPGGIDLGRLHQLGHHGSIKPVDFPLRCALFSATPGGTCPLVNATFHTDFGPAFYHVITQKGNALVSHWKAQGAILHAVSSTTA